jgi:K+-sensing histidine kinase KdpD
MSAMSQTTRSRLQWTQPMRGWMLWCSALALVTAALLPFRAVLGDVHVTLAYLLLVVAAGARRGRPVGFGLATLAFVCFDWFFVPPYGTLFVAKRVDWIVLLGFLATSIIVTQLFERARREADAARMARVREAVAASVSHDLRTPLTTIKALAHDIAAEGDERAEVIEQEANRLTRLVTDLLDFSRLNSGAIALAIEPNEVEDLLGVALDRVAGAANGRTIAVALDPGEPLLFGRFDFTQTLRALVNLLENALKYSPSGTPVDVTVRREREWLAFSIGDRGPGIDPAERERVFDPFHRAPGVAPDTDGAGLGLSIARALAEAQGGSLSYSPRDGGGSVFTLRLPAIDVSTGATG